MGLNVLNIVFPEFFFKRVQNGGPALATAWRLFDFFVLLLIFRLRYGIMGMSEFAVVFENCAVLESWAWLAGWPHTMGITIHSTVAVQAGSVRCVIAGATALYPALAWLFRWRDWKKFMGLLRGSAAASVRGNDGDRALFRLFNTCRWRRGWRRIAASAWRN
jgi:hypothetical protein